MDKDHGAANIQDDYLARARKERTWLTLFLNSGKKVVGRIRSFDRYTLILEDRGGEQMVFKHAIATITTTRTFANAIPLDRPAKGKEGSERPARPAGDRDAAVAQDLPGPPAPAEGE